MHVTDFGTRHGWLLERLGTEVKFLLSYLSIAPTVPHKNLPHNFCWVSKGLIHVNIRHKQGPREGKKITLM